VVQKRMLMDGEAMRQIMRSQATFAGMEVLTYCFMSNHFHIFVRRAACRAYARQAARVNERGFSKMV
jgi:REP element-mobilizing transposase RayT